MQVVNDSRVHDVQSDSVPVNPQSLSMKPKPREQIQSDTVTQKSSTFQEGTHLPHVHSQLARALRALSAVPEPEEIPCSKPVMFQPGLRAVLTHPHSPGAAQSTGWGSWVSLTQLCCLWHR